MTEFSMLPWQTRTGTGDGATSYTQPQANEFFRDFHISNLASGGVLYGVDNQLEVTGSASPLSVDTGKGWCYGRYWNDAVVNLTVTTPTAPAADTGGRVVLRTDWATQTTRLAISQSADGTVAPPALTQTAGTTWEVSLATYVIDAAGNIWTDSTKTTAGVTDTRHYVIGTTTGMVKLRSLTLSGNSTAINIADIQTDLTSLELHVNIFPSTTTPGGLAPWWWDMTFNNSTGSTYNWISEYYEYNTATQFNTRTTGDTRLKQVGLYPWTGAVAAALRRYATRTVIKIPNYSIRTGGTSYTFVAFAESAIMVDTGFVMRSEFAGGWYGGSTQAITSIQLLENSVTNAPFGGFTEVELYGYK